jgi:hypothetical protein
MNSKGTKRSGEGGGSITPPNISITTQILIFAGIDSQIYYFFDYFSTSI